MSPVREPEGGVRQDRATKRGVFEVTQDPIIIPQAAYNSPTTLTFPIDCCRPVCADFADAQKTFKPIDEDRGSSALPSRFRWR